MVVFRPPVRKKEALAPERKPILQRIIEFSVSTNAGLRNPPEREQHVGGVEIVYPLLLRLRSVCP